MRRILVFPCVTLAVAAFGMTAASAATGTTTPMVSPAAGKTPATAKSIVSSTEKAVQTVQKAATTPAAKAASPAAATPKGVSPSSARKMVNLNTATKAQLQSVKGIGPVMAADIMKRRPFTNVSQFETELAKDFSKKALRKVEPLVTVG